MSASAEELRQPILRRSIRGLRRLALVGLAAGILTLIGGAAIRRPSSEPIEGVETTTGLTYKTVGLRALKLDLYRPEGPIPESGWPTVLAIHGGGWCGGDRRDFGRSLAALAQHGIAVVSVDYRLAKPDRPSWPRNLEDVRDAVRWVRRHGPALGLDPERVAALGASAGGHLAALLGVGDVNSSARVDAVIAFYAPTDLETLRQNGGPTGAIDSMIGGTPEHRPGLHTAASPLRHITIKAAPMLMIHGDRDPVIPLAQSQALEFALAEAGVRRRLLVIEGAAHGFGLEVEGQDLLPQILEFLSESWKDRTHLPEGQTASDDSAPQAPPHVDRLEQFEADGQPSGFHLVPPGDPGLRGGA